MGIRELLRHERRFRYVWLAQVVSELGDWFQLVALVSMFPTRGSGASIVAALVVARHVVAAIVSPLAGVVSDRYPRGTVMIFADLGRVFVALGFLAVRGPEDVGLVFVLSLLLEALATLFEPARGAAIAQVVPPGRLFAANALAGATWSSVLALGSLAGGLTAAYAGRRAAFVINAASFALSALFVRAARIPPLEAPASDAPRAHPLADLREGLQHLRAHPDQASLLVAKPGALLSGGFFVLVSVFADRLLPGNNAVTMGLLLGARGLGALVMPFVLARLLGSGARGASRALLVAFPMAAFAFAGFSLAPSVGLAAACLVFAHGGTSTAWVGSSQLLQLAVPNRVLGRVLSVEWLATTASVAFSGTAAAFLLGQDRLGPRGTGLVLAATMLVPALAWTLAYRAHAPRFRAYESNPETAERQAAK